MTQQKFNQDYIFHLYFLPHSLLDMKTKKGNMAFGYKASWIHGHPHYKISRSIGKKHYHYSLVSSLEKQMFLRWIWRYSVVQMEY